MARATKRKRITCSLTTAITAALGIATVTSIDRDVNRYEERATHDLVLAARQAGFEQVSNVRLRYPFWMERLGLVSRNDEPHPYGYASLDVVLDGCALRGVEVSATPDTRGARPRPVNTERLRFQIYYYDLTRRSPHTPAGQPPEPYLERLEFTDRDHLRQTLQRTQQVPVVDDRSICRALYAHSQPIHADGYEPRVEPLVE